MNKREGECDCFQGFNETECVFLEFEICLVRVRNHFVHKYIRIVLRLRPVGVKIEHSQIVIGGNEQLALIVGHTVRGRTARRPTNSHAGKIQLNVLVWHA